MLQRYGEPGHCATSEINGVGAPFRPIETMADEAIALLEQYSRNQGRLSRNCGFVCDELGVSRGREKAGKVMR